VGWEAEGTTGGDSWGNSKCAGGRAGLPHDGGGEARRLSLWVEFFGRASSGWLGTVARLHSAHLYRKVGATQTTANAAGVQRMSRRERAVANDTDGKNLRRKRRPPRCARKRRGQR
jgi:hypothetical protein